MIQQHYIFFKTLHCHLTYQKYHRSSVHLNLFGKEILSDGKLSGAKVERISNRSHGCNLFFLAILVILSYFIATSLSLAARLSTCRSVSLFSGAESSCIHFRSNENLLNTFNDLLNLKSSSNNIVRPSELPMIVTLSNRNLSTMTPNLFSSTNIQFGAITLLLTSLRKAFTTVIVIPNNLLANIFDSVAALFQSFMFPLLSTPTIVHFAA